MQQYMVDQNVNMYQKVAFNFFAWVCKLRILVVYVQKKET